MPLKDTYDIAAYYWPAYHDEPRWRPFFEGREGEWEIIRKARPKFEGHFQPRVPLWGYTDESTPEAMEQKIAAAADYGVNTFIFDWYWYEDRPFLEDCLNEGFLRAKNSDRVRFYLMWANHNATTLWDLKRSHDIRTIWPGAVTRRTFEAIVDRVIDRYLTHPSYYQIGGSPVFSIYEVGVFLESFGGVDGARAALDHFRQRVMDTGFPDLHLQAILWNDLPERLVMTKENRPRTRAEVARDLSFNSVTNYQFVHHAFPVDDYVAWAKAAVDQWQAWDRELGIPYFPHVSIGWDTNPRLKEYFPTVKHGTTPENFSIFLKKAKAYADAHPGQPKLITLNAWNEWSEGSYLEPDERFGMQYLEAVRSVFGADRD